MKIKAFCASLEKSVVLFWCFKRLKTYLWVGIIGKDGPCLIQWAYL